MSDENERAINELTEALIKILNVASASQILRCPEITSAEWNALKVGKIARIASDALGGRDECPERAGGKAIEHYSAVRDGAQCELCRGTGKVDEEVKDE